VDFAYQIHTEIGQQMLMAKVNGVPTHPSHELKLAEVVEVVRQKGPPTHYSLKRQSEFLTYAKSRSTRHKILKFLKTNVSPSGQERKDSKVLDRKKTKQALLREENDKLADVMPAAYEQGGVLWLILRCTDEVGLLANVASIISSSGVSIRAYSGSVNSYTDTFLMNFELVGDAEPDKLQALCDTLNELRAITSFALGCNWSPPVNTYK
jgi:(p)ppGpp synthase/HD superfamily hydrolase